MSNRRSYIASLAASIKVIYSASVDDSATVGCFLDYQLIGSPFSIKKSWMLTFGCPCPLPNPRLNIFPLRVYPGHRK